LGAVLIYTAAYMMVSGAELILSRLLNARRRATVGLSLVAGATVMMLPAVTAQLPPSLQPILGSGLMVGTLCAIGLNLLFRIGVAQQGELTLAGPHPAALAARFLEDRGGDWGARREVIHRAGIAIGEALEHLSHTGVITGAARLVVRFDEYRLWLTLDYPGHALPLAPVQAVDAQALLALHPEDKALDAALLALSSALIQQLADRVHTRAHPGRAELRLEFAH